MGKIITRCLDPQLPAGKSAFLWGPRQVGKTHWIVHSFLKDDHHLIDLLKTDVYAEYASRPALLRERWAGKLTVIDEIQKIPALLDEIHWLIENRSASFLLTGSSARKLRKTHANLLAGRARRLEMGPLTFFETEGFELEKVLSTGLLPPHFLSPTPLEDLRDYVSDYLQEEVAAESTVRNIPAFSEFLRVAAMTNSELLNYTNIARESGVSAKVARNYFEILEDTLLGKRLSPWKSFKKRRVLTTDKFYFFDVGIANYLAKRRPLPGGADFGKSFEHYIFMELSNYQKYRDPELSLRYWKSASGLEVDFVCGDMHTAIEIKSSRRIHPKQLKGLTALREEYAVKNLLLVCLEEESRIVEGDIHILPWKIFLQKVWNEELLRQC